MYCYIRPMLHYFMSVLCYIVPTLGYIRLTLRYVILHYVVLC